MDFDGQLKWGNFFPLIRSVFNLFYAAYLSFSLNITVDVVGLEKRCFYQIFPGVRDSFCQLNFPVILE